MTQFKSKTHAMNQRQIIWVCKTCEMQHDKNLLSLTKKPVVCISCRAPREFYYFASRAEAIRFAELRLQERAGVISKLHTQVSYPVVINSVPVTKYIADFVYFKNGQRIIEDVKGNVNFLTDVFKLKQKLIGAIYGVKINLIQR